LAPSLAALQGQRQQSRRDAGATNVKGAQLKLAATKATATANQLQLLPGSMNLNRPLQIQLRPPKKAGGRYKFKNDGNFKCLAAIHHGTCLIQPSQMASERVRARITAQLSRDMVGDGLAGFWVRLGSSGICDSPVVRLLRNFVV